jgi:hypothetical protein
MRRTSPNYTLAPTQKPWKRRSLRFAKMPAAIVELETSDRETIDESHENVQRSTRHSA